MELTIDQLNVYYRSRLTGTLRRQQGVLSFQYHNEYLKYSNPRPLSVSLPLTAEPFDYGTTLSFFSGLLPDERVRKNLARYLRISEQNVFELLKHVGGECAGAISVYPDGIDPLSVTQNKHRFLSDHEADHLIQELDKRPLLIGEEDVRISGAGAQDKLIISYINGKIGIPLGNTPSTHILKPGISGLDETVFNEFYCMTLAREIGMQVPKVQVLWIHKKPYYLIERYDRDVSSEGIINRIHQEDFCQALNVPPEQKYEAEGGPSLLDCFQLLDRGIREGKTPGIDKIRLFEATIFNFLIGNGDAHGKNFSLLYQGEALRLAPFYDLLSTLIYGNVFKSKCAMKIGGEYVFNKISRRNFQKLSNSLGFREDYGDKQMKRVCTLMKDKGSRLAQHLNQNQNTQSPIYEKIVDLIEKNIQKLSC